MQTIYLSSQDGRFTSVDEISDGVWINLVDPTPAEIRTVATQCDIDPDDLRAALDPEERSRVTTDSGNVMILVDVPITEHNGDQSSYITIPLGIIIAGLAIITVCSQSIPVIKDFESNRVRAFRTFMKTRFTLQLLLHNAASYLAALREMDKLIDRQEASLRHSTRNEELTKMLGLEKSLVYINTSLVSNQRVLERLARTAAVKKYPEDNELLQDTIIENEQAMEMSNIYSGILTGTMDAYASVIANNQNAIMKTLALVTIVLSVPTMIFSAFGMNFAITDNIPLFHSPWGFLIAVGISFAIAVSALAFFIRKKWF